MNDFSVAHWHKKHKLVIIILFQTTQDVQTLSTVWLIIIINVTENQNTMKYHW